MKAYVAGTCDTKGAELAYVRDLIAAAGVPTVLVDLGTRSEAATRTSRRRRWRPIIRTAPPPCSATTAARRSRRWRKPSRASP